MAKSILEEFVLLFSSNAEDVEQGSEKAKKTTDELEQSLQKTDSTSTKVGASLLNVAKQFSAAVLASAGIGSIVGNIREALDYSVALYNASYYLGTSVEQLDAWGSAVERNGGSSTTFIQSLKGISNALNEVDRNGFRPAAMEFARFGIRVTDARGRLKDVIDILPDISRVFEKMSNTKSFAIGKKLGLDEGTITLLQQGRKEVDAFIQRQKELGTVTKQDAEIAYKFNQQWADTAHAFRSIFILVATSVLPTITRVGVAFEKFAVFAKEHAEFISGALIALSFALLKVVVPAALTAARAFAPFLIIGGLFALIYDDIQNYLKGNNSLLGEIEQKYPRVFAVLKEIGASTVEFVNLIKDAFSGLSGVLDDVLFLAKAISNAYDAVDSALRKDSGRDDLHVDTFKKAMANPGERESDDIAFRNSLQRAKQAISLASTNPIGSQTSNSISALTNNNARNITLQIGEIKIETQATDAQGLAQGLKDTLSDQIRQGLANMDSGLLA